MMELKSEFTVNVKENDAREFLTNPEKFAQCLPGLQNYEVQDNTFKATFKLDVSEFNVPHMSSITAIIHAKIVKSEVIEIIGDGRAAGIRLKLNICLSVQERENSTRILWKATVDLGLLGKLLGEDNIKKIIESNVNYIISCISEKMI